MAKKKKEKSPKFDERKGGETESMEKPLLVDSGAQTTTNRIVICKASGCFDMATVGDHCRLHYLSNWKKLKTKEAKRQGKELEDYLQELATRFPEEFIERLRNEIEEMSQEASDGGGDDREDRSNFFEADEGDEDMDTIIKGIRVEDF